MPVIPAASAATQTYSGPNQVVYIPGSYISTHDMYVSQAGMTPNVAQWVYLTPCEILRTITIDTLDISITTAFTGGTNVGRVGLYRSKTSGEPYPGLLLVDGGSTSWATTGVKTNSITPLQLTPGLYWFALQSDTFTTGQVRACTAGAFNRATIGFYGGPTGGVMTQLVHSKGAYGLQADYSSFTYVNWSPNGSHVYSHYARIASVP